MQTNVKSLHENLRAGFKLQWIEGETDRLAKQEIEHMFSEFGPDRSREAVSKFIRTEQFLNFSKLRDYVPSSADALPKLYDQNCPNCDEGWEVVGWSYLGPNKRNRLVKMYGFEEAQRQEARVRCRVCWKGKVQ